MSATISVFSDQMRAEFSAREERLIKLAEGGSLFLLFRFWHEKRIQFLQCAAAKE